jgi:hypothetical protein
MNAVVGNEPAGRQNSRARSVQERKRERRFSDARRTADQDSKAADKHAACMNG